MSHCKWYLKLLEIPRDADNAKCMHICPIKAERCFLAIYEESCAFYGKWIQIILSVCVSQSSISSIYHIVDGEWRLEDTSHYVNYFTVGIIFWGQLMQNKILLAGGRSKLSDMSPEARSLGGCGGHLQASQGISNLPSQLSAEHKITKCNNNIFTGVPALPYWLLLPLAVMFFSMQSRSHY